MLARPERPVKESPRRSPESRRFRRASARQSRQTLPVHSAPVGGRAPLEDEAVQEATLLSYAKSITTFTTWRPSTSPLQLPGITVDCHLLVFFDHASFWSTSTTRSCVATDRTWEPRCYPQSNTSSLVSVETENNPSHGHTELFKDGRNSPPATFGYLSHSRG